MEDQDNVEVQHVFPQNSEPEELLKEFRDRSAALDQRLSALQDLIVGVRYEIQDQQASSLHQLAKAAADMANGRVYQKIDMEAKGELGALVESLNTTLANLQQLDASVKQQSTQVPELAAQLDAITADTETATQTVMNRLDTLMNTAGEGEQALEDLTKALEIAKNQQVAFHSRIHELLERAGNGADSQQVAQEILDFVFEQSLTTRPPETNISEIQDKMRIISDEAFEILNTLQFQDITRQKVEKVVMLLKKFQQGLQRLLHIFKIDTPEEIKAEIFENRTTTTQDHIFDTSLEMDNQKESVDDIIAQFKKNQN